MTERRIRVGLLGCGTVGSATARILLDHSDDILRRTGAAVDLAKIAVRDLSKERSIDGPELWTSDSSSVVNDPSIDVIAETIGGIEPARELILASFAAGKAVVTANKELLSTHGQEVMDAADKAGVDFLFEASVGGGIPIIRPLKESLAGDRVVRIMGILNGTTNFILTRMSETGGRSKTRWQKRKRLAMPSWTPVRTSTGTTPPPRSRSCLRSRSTPGS